MYSIYIYIYKIKSQRDTIFLFPVKEISSPFFFLSLEMNSDHHFFTLVGMMMIWHSDWELYTKLSNMVVCQEIERKLSQLTFWCGLFIHWIWQWNRRTNKKNKIKMVPHFSWFILLFINFAPFNHFLPSSIIIHIYTMQFLNLQSIIATIRFLNSFLTFIYILKRVAYKIPLHQNRNI